MMIGEFEFGGESRFRWKSSANGLRIILFRRRGVSKKTIRRSRCCSIRSFLLRSLLNAAYSLYPKYSYIHSLFTIGHYTPLVIHYTLFIIHFLLCSLLFIHYTLLFTLSLLIILSLFIFVYYTLLFSFFLFVSTWNQV